MERPTIICLTPVKNEAWILRRFLECASLWADYIVIADQNSTDNSREIASEFSKVVLVNNSSQFFNEPDRQKLLIDTARQLAKNRLLITLDADEILTANFLDSPEWKTVLDASPGTIIRFQRVNLLPDMCSYWLDDTNKSDFPWGFMDDGSEHIGMKIHSNRIPLPTTAPSINLRSVKVLHYQFVDWERMQSKHRWY